MSLCINPSCSKPHNPDNHLFCQACGSELLLAGRYRVTRLLSDKGGFSNAYEVIDNHTPKVLKVLTNNHPHAVELFEKEARVLSQLNHPGIPKGEGSFTYFPRDSQTPLHCLVMEKIEGMDLEEYQKQRQNHPIDQKLALEWLTQLASILKEVHRHNFFHRDIKPSNIIFKPNGQLALIDFGAVRQVTATIMAGKKNTGIYTPGYASPEQEKGYGMPQSDFYALGRTFVYLLTGKEPTDTAMYDLYNNQLNWHSHAPNIAPQLADFIDNLMAEKANDRPANISGFLKQLEAIKRELSYRNPKIPQNVEENKIFLFQYAGFWLRLQSAITDAVVVTILAALIGGFISFRLIKIGAFDDLRIIDFVTGIRFGEENLIETVLLCSIYTILGTSLLGFIIFNFSIFCFISNPELFSKQDILIISTILVPVILGGFLKWLYFILLESSWWQATFGKMILGLTVTDLNGKRISWRRANKRYWVKLFSVMTLYIGFMLAGWTKKKRALHDIIAGTLIVKKS